MFTVLGLVTSFQLSMAGVISITKAHLAGAMAAMN